MVWAAKNAIIVRNVGHKTHPKAYGESFRGSPNIDHLVAEVHHDPLRSAPQIDCADPQIPNSHASRLNANSAAQFKCSTFNLERQ
jgi:hypothetical protein